MPERLLGIRHHGPGSARAVVQELSRSRPDILLIEGPPDADEIIGFAAAPAMVPPVALLVYAQDDPKRSRFYPFGDTASHVIGYVAAVSEKELGQDNDDPLLELPDFRIGKNGVEKALDLEMRGTAGTRMLRDIDPMAVIVISKPSNCQGVRPSSRSAACGASFGAGASTALSGSRQRARCVCEPRRGCRVTHGR